MNDTTSKRLEDKNVHPHPHWHLHSLLKQICYRLQVIDRAQIYIIDQTEGTSNSLSLVKIERVELERKTKDLMSQWVESCGLKDHEDENRSSSSNINISIENVPSKSSVHPSIYTTAKFRKTVTLIAAIVAGSVLGCLWVLKFLHIIK